MCEGKEGRYGRERGIGETLWEGRREGERKERTHVESRGVKKARQRKEMRAARML